MGRIGGKNRQRRPVIGVAQAVLAIGAIALAGSVAPTATQAAAINCHNAKDGSCTKIGPYPMPLSVPEFNRLAANLQNDAKSAATLLLFALLNAGETPRLAGELGSLRLATQNKAMADGFRRFATRENVLAARCAASFVSGARAPSYRYTSTAVAFWVRAGASPDAAKSGMARQSVALCSSVLGCLSLDLVRDTDNGWLVVSPAPLIEACKTLKK